MRVQRVKGPAFARFFIAIHHCCSRMEFSAKRSNQASCPAAAGVPRGLVAQRWRESIPDSHWDTPWRPRHWPWRGPAGTFSLAIDLTSLPTSPPAGVMTGDVWHFHAWFRDKNPTKTSKLHGRPGDPFLTFRLGPQEIAAAPASATA